jgi:hypothetical protein
LRSGVVEFALGSTTVDPTGSVEAPVVLAVPDEAAAPCCVAPSAPGFPKPPKPPLSPPQPAVPKAAKLTALRQKVRRARRVLFSLSFECMGREDM